MEKEKTGSKLTSDYVKEFSLDLFMNYPRDKVTPRRKLMGYRMYVLREQKKNPSKNKYKVILSKLDRMDKLIKWF